MLDTLISKLLKFAPYLAFGAMGAIIKGIRKKILNGFRKNFKKLILGTFLGQFGPNDNSHNMGNIVPKSKYTFYYFS